MKVKALRSFLHKGKVIEVGAVVDLHEEEAMPLIRFKRVEEAGAMEPVGDKPLEAMKKDELLTLAMERGITEVAKEMKKEEIIELIKKFEV